MPRCVNWPDLLVRYIMTRERTPFRWGRYKHDCASFAFGWIYVATGLDLMHDVPDYSTAEEADRLLFDIGFERTIDPHLRRKPIGMAQRGDVALAWLSNGETLLIVEGEELVGPGRRGLERAPRSTAIMAWEV